MQRFAIYFTPSPESALAQAAAAWLGRDMYHKEMYPLPEIPGLTEERVQTLLQSPRHYGFHATLKPPFRLKPGCSPAMLEKRLEAFAASASAFILPPLRIELMSRFFCLRLEEPPELIAMAANIVQAFDDLRQEPDAAELQKRRAAGLSANQEAMLQAWGYPYVLDEYRFHLTLTGRVQDQTEQEVLAAELAKRFPAPLLERIPFDSLALFIEEDKKPLRALARYPLRTT